MAHKTGNEETEFKVAPPRINSRAATKTPPPPPDTPHPQLTSSSPPVSASSSSSPVLASSSPSPMTSSSRSASPRSSPVVKGADPGKGKRSSIGEEAEVSMSMPMKRKVNRCSGCSKKVGLTGFRCRCGELFCSDHRYSDRHDCSYDYKSAGREAIARENPVVKAAKIVKI